MSTAIGLKENQHIPKKELILYHKSEKIDNMKKIFLYIFMLRVLFACQNNKVSITNNENISSITQENKKMDSIGCKKAIMGEIKLSEIEKVTLNTKLLEIVKQDKKYKYSCADTANYEYVLLTKDSLSITEIEPLTFSIKMEKVSEKELLIIKESHVPNKFRVSIVDNQNGITFWECINQDGEILEEPFSFYAIPVENLNKACLETQVCD
ncbi:hypothetical protein CGC48_02255 [Capnocytophaga cynodegmi]|uniref:Uncharacterized protein n=1 Tax=Capnocytophaga cynodegmi TaxID=28189 RepID=A0A286NTW1_9FLAO|nr:hypothetical protein [Capnocytophaga cynodegmi]ATA67554.1 hypothetical protein CGC48_02255 [Capnocytophaga cynodegmi]